MVMKQITSTVSRLVAVALVLVFVGVAQAQAQGASVHFYIVPKVGSGVSGDRYRAKYIADSSQEFVNGTGAIAGFAAAMDYGFENIMLVGANVTAAEDAFISAQPDVWVLPAGNLNDQIVSINLTTLKNTLEGMKIPAGWITIASTHRDVGRFVAQLFLIFQRYHFLAVSNGMNGSPFAGGITLDSTFGDMTVARRQVLSQAAQSLGIDVSGVTLTTTIRQAFRLLAPQLGNIQLAGVTF